MYPGLFRRIAATLIDLFVIFGVISFIYQRPLFAQSAEANLLASIVFVLIYEPLLVVFACTVGQAAMATRVRHFESFERITVGKSYLRFLVKYIAGVFGAARARGMNSVVPNKFLPREDLRAIHDEAADTVVLNASETER